MNRYIIFAKGDDIIPVDLMSKSATDEIDAFIREGFEILSESCEAETSMQALATWETQLRSKEQFEFILTSSTSYISDNLTITDNKGIITATIVAGANILRDIAASYRDAFGGQSKAYTNKLESMKSDVLLSLREQAHKKGCNAIVGLSIDVDEVSGGGKSMFMVTAMGTAVKVEERP